MQTLIFGDSLTWGFEAPGKLRDKDKRWSRLIVLNNPEHDIIVNGVCGRSLVAIKPERKNTMFDGQFDIKNFLNTNWAADRLVVFLGGNDLVHGQLDSVDALRDHVKEFLQSVYKATEWKKDRFEIVLVVPPAFGDKVQAGYEAKINGGLEKAYEGLGHKVINLNTLVAQSAGKPDTDGVHMTAKEDKIILETLEKELF